MGFRITSVTQQEVILQRDKSTRNFRNVFVIIAAVFAAIGFTGLYFTWSGNSPAFPFFCIFTGIAVFLLLIGPVVAKLRQVFDPEKIVFSNSHGTVTVYQDKTEQTKACIPYAAIPFFGIYEQRQTNTSSNTTTTGYYYRYIVFFQKNDGSRWELSDSTSQQDAQVMLLKLQQVVKLDAPGECPPSKTISPKLQLTSPGSAAGLEWRNNSLPQLLLFIPIVVLIGCVLGFFWNIFNGMQSGNEPDWFFRIVLGFISFIFAAVIGTQFYKIIKDARTVYEITIGRTDFRYAEKSKSGKVRKEITYKLSDIKGVLYSYKLNKGESDIFILRENEMTQHRKMLQGDISYKDLTALIRTSVNELNLRITALNATERLQLENWIQQTIADKTNNAVTLL